MMQRKIISGYFYLSLIVIALLIYQNITNANNLISKVYKAEYQEYTMENQLETLMNLKEDNWKPLSRNQKLSMLQTIIYVEMNSLGVMEKILLELEEMDETTAAYYNDESKTIVLNKKYLEANENLSRALVKTICHECYHAYQYKLVDLYNSVSDNEKNLNIMEKPATYKYELENYVSISEDLEGYLSQEVEIDADEYSKEQTQKYYDFLYNNSSY